MYQNWLNINGHESSTENVSNTASAKRINYAIIKRQMCRRYVVAIRVDLGQ